MCGWNVNINHLYFAGRSLSNLCKRSRLGLVYTSVNSQCPIVTRTDISSMFSFPWLTVLQRQYRTRFRRNARARLSRNQYKCAPRISSAPPRRTIEVLEDRTLLTAFTVVNTNDSGAGSLRAAIEAANAGGGADTISFDAALAGQTIVLTDELLISDDLTITGLGADQLTIDGNGDSRIFNLNNGIADEAVTVEITGLTLTNGSADSGAAIISYESLSLSGMVFSDNIGSSSGGAIYSDDWHLSISDSEFLRNTSRSGGAIYSQSVFLNVDRVTFTDNTVTGNRYGTGGAITNIAGSMWVTNSFFSQNTASRLGGAIHNSQYSSAQISNTVFLQNRAQSGGGISSLEAFLNVADSTFTENQATENGGAVFVNVYESVVIGSQATISGSTFSMNSAGDSGGGIANYYGTLIVEHSFLHANKSLDIGGGIDNRGTLTLLSSTLSENTADSFGGAISNIQEGTATIFNSTLSGNTTLFLGGGLYSVTSSPVTIINSTITGNSAVTSGGGLYVQGSKPQVSNTIIAGNLANTSAQIFGAVTGVKNIFQESVENLIDPVLRFNGGATPTHALLAGSAAIDAGRNNAATQVGLNTDQRGESYARINSGTVDIGAYEFNGYTLVVDTLSDEDDGNYATGQLSLREAIRLANESPFTETIVFDESLSGHTIIFSQEIAITDDLKIIGLGRDQLTLDGNGDSRIFNISDGVQQTRILVEISGLTLTNGYAENGGAISCLENLSIVDSTITGNTALENGGGIDSDFGIVTISNSSFTANQASRGGGISSDAGLPNVFSSVFNISSSIFAENIASDKGGGLYVSAYGMEIYDSDFTRNSAESGGGIFIQWAFNKPLIYNCRFTDNTVLRSGGGIHNATSGLRVYYSSFTGNAATGSPYWGVGGGLYNSGYSVQIWGSIFSSNTARSEGGGVYLSGEADIGYTQFSGNSALYGGGLHYSGNTLSIYDSSFIENVALENGGGINHQGLELELESIRFIGNTAAEFGGGLFSQGDLLVQRSLFTENTTGTFGGAVYANSFGTTTIYNTTLSGNAAFDQGGGFYSRSNYPVTIINCTIVGNTATNKGGGIAIYNIKGKLPSNMVSPMVTNTIVAGNTAASDSQVSGPFFSDSNIIQDSIQGLLDPVLRDHGGRTMEHALLPGSAAINAGNTSIVWLTGLHIDQRSNAEIPRVVEWIVDIGAFEYQGPFTYFDLRVVETETPVAGNGETESIPLGLSVIDEWQPYWLEIWVSSSTLESGIFSVSLNFNYNTAITTATRFEFGSAFTLNQMGTINDQLGMITGLSAESSLTDVGDDQYVLFARIRFESTPEDGIDLDSTRPFLTVAGTEFSIDQPEIRFVGGAESEEIIYALSDFQIQANPFDLNDDERINFRDLQIFMNAYGSQAATQNNNLSQFIDYNQNGRVDLNDLILLAMKYGTTKNETESSTVPVNGDQLLIVEAPAISTQVKTRTVTQNAAETVLESVVEQISPPLTSDQRETLEAVNIEVVDLAAGTLGRAVPGTIYIDVNAAGFGWFVDATPTDNSEFSSSSELSLIALPDSEAAGHVDLWTVILHELGHLLGYEHAEEDVMQESLLPGERHLADWNDNTDQFFMEFPAESVLTSF